jgi:sugar lactone lactonase YvrE
MRFVGLTLSLFCGAVMAVAPVGGVYASLANGTADAVWGQPDFVSGGCNASKTSAATLCHPVRSVTDSRGNLWVSDWYNNRVLMYRYDRVTRRPSKTASDVIGQYGDFTTRGCNQAPPSSDYPSAPSRFTLCGPNGLVLDRKGTLYVADQFNNRVLVYFHALNRNHGDGADLVLGQTTFTAVSPNQSSTGTDTSRCGTLNPANACSLFSPEGLSLDGQDDLLVADTLNNRVLLWTERSVSPSESSSCRSACLVPAARVWGQQGNMTSTCPNQPGIAPCQLSGPPTASSLNGPEDVQTNDQGDLFIADTLNNRVLEYTAALVTASQNATRVYGQDGSFVTNGEGMTAVALALPTGIAFDLTGYLWVSDEGNHRVLQFPVPTTGDALATRAIAGLGQSDFTTGVQGLNASSLDAPTDIHFDPSGNAYVVDHGESDRVLEFDPAS